MLAPEAKVTPAGLMKKNCGALPANLVESILFGHEKGAFTGAITAKVGKFQAAQGGTVFLDEIGDMPISLQASLLRVLQEKTLTPVGSNNLKKVDVRVLAATNANLEQKIEQGQFRLDLFYRLNVLPIYVKPLREHPEDILLLSQAFLSEANEDAGTKKILLQSTAEDFKKLPWLGNIRELKHTITRMVIMSDETILDPELLKAEDKSTRASTVKSKDYDTFRFKKMSDEKNLLSEALRKARSISEAARMLNMSRSTFRDKLKTHGIEIKKQETSA